MIAQTKQPKYPQTCDTNKQEQPSGSVRHWSQPSHHSNTKEQPPKNHGSPR
jgi:hypothetical protein